MALIGAAALAVVAVPVLSGSAAATPTCSNSTLSGTYTFASDGWIVSGGGTTPFALAGTETYDGAGNIAGVVTASLNGSVTSAAANTGTYSINSNCTGTAAFTNSGVTTHFDIYVHPMGRFFQFVETDTGQVTSATETRISP